MKSDYKNIGHPRDQLIEEMGEVLQAIGKAQRFGYFNKNPEVKKPVTNNFDDIIEELNDLEEAIRIFRSHLWVKLKLKKK